MISEKKCKGTGKAKGHGCGSNVKAATRRYGLGRECGCWSKWLLGTDEGGKVLNKATLKATKQRRELKAYEKQINKEKTLPALLINVRTAVHRYVKERDKGLPCISCGVPYRDNFQAGHCWAAGDYSTIRYHFKNINSQCEGCNIFKNGNESEYRLRLPHRIGWRPFNDLLSLADADGRTNHKWDREELYKVRNEANKLYKKLKNV